MKISSTRGARSGPRLGVEALEDRTLLSAGPVIDLSSLTVHGNKFASSDILVLYRGGPVALPGTSVGKAIGLVPNLYEVNLKAGTTVAAALAAYRADGRVYCAEPDYWLSSAAVPNDPQFGNQWALRNTGQNGGTPGADVHATPAWNVTKGNTRVVVALMDTGIDYDHPDLYLNVWLNNAEIPLSRKKNLIDVDGDGLITFRDLNDPRNQGPGKITDVNHDGRIDAGDILAPMVRNAQGQDTGLGGWAYAGNTLDGDTAHPNDFIGWNFSANNNNPLDDNGHGTSVAGILGAVGNNGVGVSGLAWTTQIMAVKFLDASGNGTVSQFIAGLNYAVAHGAKVSNNSWTGASFSQALYDAVNNARARGHIVVAAAGNSSVNTDVSPAYPSSLTLDNLVSVAATDRFDHLASFSDYGPKSVDIGAPGVDVLTAARGGAYATFSGTSAATPFVSAAVAMVWGLHPTWTYKQVINQVLETADPVAGLSGKVLTGGRLDVARAVGPVVAPPRVVGATFTGPSANTLSAVRLTFDRALNPTTFTPPDVVLTGPSGQAISIGAVKAVAGAGNRSFDVTFATQSAPGTYTLKVGPNIADPVGMPMQAAYQTTYRINQASTFVNNGPVPLTPGSKAVSLIAVNQDLILSQVKVTINITYPLTSDLYIHLQAPDGTDILLAKYVGGTGANFTNTTFDDSASTWIVLGRAPFTGSFMPEVPLNILNGKNARGYWKLWVEDRGGNSGTLNSWSLTLKGA
jgi:subtilisin family serine protease/subtilisin-like proprotein convertase family protein